MNEIPFEQKLAIIIFVLLVCIVFFIYVYKNHISRRELNEQYERVYLFSAQNP